MDGGKRQVAWQFFERAVAVPVQVGGRGVLRGGDWEIGFLEKRDAIPVDFECHGKSELSCAGGKFVFEIDDDGFGFADWRSRGNVHFLPAIGGSGLQHGEGEGQFGAVRGRDVGHATAEVKPAGHGQGQRRGGVEFSKIEFDRVRLGQASELRLAKGDGREPSVVVFLQRCGDVYAVAALGLLERFALGQGDQPGIRIGAARQQFGVWMNLGTNRHIHGDELGLVEVQNLPQLLGNLEPVFAVDWFEVSRVSDPHDFIRVGVDVNPLCHRQAKGRCAEQVGDESEPLAVPTVKVRAGTGGEDEFCQRY